MRFFSNGPNIPDSLLNHRDQGRVVFLCGAGVSLNAGMPSFKTLTTQVINYFAPPEGSEIAKSFLPWTEDLDGPKESLDHLFQLLYKEYGPDHVKAAVSECLHNKNPVNEGSTEHEIIARISTNSRGEPQVITTNFDHLFQDAPSLKDCVIHIPPSLPDVELDVPITGITYLHGRLNKPSSKSHPYIISSADFGRAYLAEGWATSFVRSLIKKYTVVLVGYKAEDPPIKYLLQGLNNNALSKPSNLYAFDMGLDEEVQEKWDDRGVTAIAYGAHNVLWETLKAWAERADNSAKWRTEIINLAMQGPRKLAPFQRGQVAHLVKSSSGAKLFENTSPSPPAEWLCVFDVFCRTAKTYKSYSSDETFDPFEHYHLDDDPPKPSEITDQIFNTHDHILGWREDDPSPPRPDSLINENGMARYMPPRLFNLFSWISKQLNSPIAAWWASKQNGLNPKLIQFIKTELRNDKELNFNARHFWNLLLDYQTNNKDRANNWFHIKDRVTQEGWNSNILREFESATMPYLAVAEYSSHTKPPMDSWEENSLNLTSWSVEFPDRHNEEIDLPDNRLHSIFRIAERHLYHAVGLLEDIHASYYEIPTCYPQRETDKRRPLSSNHFFEWFLKLFLRLLKLEPEIARAHVLSWPTKSNYYFLKLRLFSWNQFELFEADEVADKLLELEQHSFWSHDDCRELLFLLLDRWEHFSEASRKALTSRLLAGPDIKEFWSEDDFPNYKNETACRYLRWLELKGCEFEITSKQQIKDLISNISEWSDEWATGLVTMDGISTYRIATDNSPDELLSLPASEIVGYLNAIPPRFDEKVEKRPFIGLVKDHPRKALASLTLCPDEIEFPAILWSELIYSWPRDVSPRMQKVFLNRVLRLPDEDFRELIQPLSAQFKESFINDYKLDKELASAVFRQILSVYASSKPLPENSTNHTYSDAVNSPIGRVTIGLIKLIDSLKLKNIPDQLQTHFEELISSKNPNNGYVISILIYHCNWLYNLNPTWVMTKVIPQLKFDHPNSRIAWSGYLSARELYIEAIVIEVKPLLLQLIPKLYEWNSDNSQTRIAAQVILQLSLFNSEEVSGLSTSEARNCLRSMQDEELGEVILQFGRVARQNPKNWDDYLIPFISSTWPKDRKLKTSFLTRRWISLLGDAGEYFPRLLNSVYRFLTPIDSGSYSLHSFTRGIKERNDVSLSSVYPEDVLEFIDAIIPSTSPYTPFYLPEILIALKEANTKIVLDQKFIRLLNLTE